MAGAAPVSGAMLDRWKRKCQITQAAAGLRARTRQGRSTERVAAPKGGVFSMRLSLSVVLVLGVMVLVLIRKSGLRVFHAVIAILFGFYLSTTAMAAQIGQLDTMVANLLGSLRP
jgi:hypothetical protein